MRILDVRGKSTEQITRLSMQYPAQFYREIGTEHRHKETTDADIKEFQKRAEKEGAVAIFISNYGQAAYIPTENKPRELPTFRGYTVDHRLREFRKIKYGETPEYIPFDSPKGKKLLQEMQVKEASAWRPEVEGHYQCTKCNWEGYLTWRQFLDAIKSGCPKCGSTIQQAIQPGKLPQTKEKLYQRGADGYPVGSDKIMRDAWGRIPREEQPFWSSKGFVKPAKIYGWAFSQDYSQWRAYVRFPDGNETWTSPRESAGHSPQTNRDPIILKGKEYWHKVNATQKAIMQRMGASRVIEVHSDGDVTFEAEGRTYVLTTSGEVFDKVATGGGNGPGKLPQTMPERGVDYYKVPPEVLKEISDDDRLL